MGGPEALGRVIRNLVDNAIRHAPPSPKVVVRVTNGDRATVEVIDEGPGFDPDRMLATFDSFVRVDLVAQPRHGRGRARARHRSRRDRGTRWISAGRRLDRRARTASGRRRPAEIRRRLLGARNLRRAGGWAVGGSESLAAPRATTATATRRTGPSTRTWRRCRGWCAATSRPAGRAELLGVGSRQ